MNILPDEILLHIMIFLGNPEMNKLNILIERSLYNSIINDILLVYIRKKVVIKNKDNNHVLIEVNPCKKITFISNDNNLINSYLTKNFIETNDNLNLWIKKFYLKKKI
jgi:hypothetical protein